MQSTVNGAPALSRPKGVNYSKLCRCKIWSISRQANPPTGLPRKVPDLLDFAVIRRIPPHSLTAESSTDLTSDHSPVFITLNARYIPYPGCPPLARNKQTGRPFEHFYRRLLPHKFPQNPVRHRRLRAPAGACNTAGGVELHPSRLPYHMRPNLRPPDQTTAHREAAPQEKMADHPVSQDKTAFNKTAKNLKQFLCEAKQQGIQAYLRNLTATDATDYSLWKATRRLIRPQTPISPPENS